ncbi:MAG: CBS domain-containing protein [Deltaproteobacteria bacterium]|nr:CBS domain-containing protein [Deltaproteobacteria bacterium]
MLVRKWMTSTPKTIGKGQSVTDAIRMLKESGIRHLPVMDGDRLVGIVTDRDLKDFSPSKATTLDMFELHYLLSKATVADAMRRNPVTVQPDDTIEKAALLMHDHKIGCLPVLGEKGRLVGLLTQEDVFEALVKVTGAGTDTVRLQMTISDQPGSIKVVTDKARAHGANLRSILTTYVNVPLGRRELILRVAGDTSDLEEELRRDYPDLIVHRGS